MPCISSSDALPATENTGDWVDQEQKRLKEAGLPYKKRVWCVGCARLNHPEAIMWERKRSEQAKRELMVNKLATGTSTALELPTAFRIFYKTALPRVQADPAMYVDGKAPRMGQLMKKMKGKLAICLLLCRAATYHGFLCGAVLRKPTLALCPAECARSAHLVLRTVGGTQPRGEGAIRAGCTGIPHGWQVSRVQLGLASKHKSGALGACSQYDYFTQMAVACRQSRRPRPGGYEPPGAQEGPAASGEVKNVGGEDGRVERVSP